LNSNSKTNESYQCVSNERWKKEIQSTSQLEVTYTVRYDDAYNLKDSSRDFSCTCKGYNMQQAKDGYCKHIHEAKKSYCGWRQDRDHGDPIHRKYENSNTTGVETFCPACGAFAYLYPGDEEE